ncbi:histidine kinase [Pedobacter sp. BS3]|uniref:sensor histidine kinase n=1 Tax=Pedobacter sp. BS3 TaxID=2567937 RepID=UPI0011EC9D14|nr:histidine kinase [Pedobacter sp. BS3]TZF82121.1 histidine kinase [Pedobacter sp. BS3]
MLKKLYLNKYLLIAIHVLFWGLFIMLPYFFRPSAPEHRFGAVNSMFQYRFIASNLLLVVLFYVNTYLLFPLFYKRKKLLIYIISVCALIVLFVYLSSYIDRHFFSENLYFKHTENSFPHKRIVKFKWWFFPQMMSYLFVTGISFSYAIIVDTAKKEKIRKEKENENLKTELGFLRSQVSPHFIFNTLNNLVSLARKKSDQLEPALIRLSNLIRYMLYENDDEKVSLSREIDYLQDYIDLQYLRFGDDITIHFKKPRYTEAYMIEPMLLVPFVENAFKHGIGLVDNPVISINATIDDKTGWLNFDVENSIPSQQSAKDKSSGIGLNNVKRRLELLYHDSYELNITETESKFRVNLKIKLL